MEGLSTGDFEPVFRELVGETTPLSPNAIVRLKQGRKSIGPGAAGCLLSTGRIYLGGRRESGSGSGQGERRRCCV